MSRLLLLTVERVEPVAACPPPAATQPYKPTGTHKLTGVSPPDAAMPLLAISSSLTAYLRMLLVVLLLPTLLLLCGG